MGLFGYPPACFFDIGASSLALNEFPLFRGGALGLAAARFGDLGPCLESACLTERRDLFGESLPCGRPVHALTARVADGHREARGDMGQGDGRGDLVNVLASRAGGAGKTLLQVFVAEQVMSHEQNMKYEV